MNLQEIQRRLRDLSDLRFIPTERKGSTGIGYTIEQRLGISENNLPIPDIGGRVEIKATRNSVNNLITLFTFNKGVWNFQQKDIINRYGYLDNKNRQSLYSTISSTKINSQGLQIKILENSEAISVVHASTSESLARWDLYHMVGKFMTKFERLLLIHANTRKNNKIEEFHFNQASLLTNPSSKMFRDGFDSGKVMIDIRMHLGETGSVRNHGTGFRIHEHDLPSLFENHQNLL